MIVTPAKRRLRLDIAAESPQSHATGIGRQAPETVDDIGEAAGGDVMRPPSEVAAEVIRLDVVRGKELDEVQARWNLALADDLVIEAGTEEVEGFRDRR